MQLLILKQGKYGNIVYPRITQESLEELSHVDDSIQYMAELYDVLAIEPQDTRDLDGSRDIYEHYLTDCIASQNEGETFCEAWKTATPDSQDSGC